MGDPKFSRKTYDTPSHPWQGERIKAEVEVVRAFGLKNKTEVWKAETILRNLRKQSRDLQARLRTGDKQAQKEADDLMKNAQAKIKELRQVTNDYVDDSMKRTEDAIAQALSEVRESRSKFRALVNPQQAKPSPIIEDV